MRTLAELLMDWRQQRGLSQDAAAQLCEVSPSLWSRIEGGERIQLRLPTFQKLSVGTGIMLSVLTAAAAYSLAEAVTA